MLRPTDVLREPPFNAVVQHMETIVETVELIKPLFTALRDGDDEGVARLCEEITVLEDAADQIKNAVRDHLPRAIRLPVSRRDLLTVVSAQDTISDNALQIVWLLEVRKFSVPEAIEESLFVLLDLVMQTVYQAQGLCKDVGVLAEARFRGPHVEEAAQFIQGVDRLEASCDKQAREVLRSLFDAEEAIGPVDTILWHQIVELIGSLADASKKLANRVRLLIAR